ncbi:CASP-like protein 5A3 [Hordeum vulgare subsp. vulgare]|uniref:CASP-like protein n=1 Tax=Hordeum vulgare subsp. vulgare TaxID=112509 RepID=A0A8I6XSJ0_HORVV|nr:CASP-like protein 5A3 [Hordeum vulgare subsp. vulgare]XP_044984260.1 CASP-like protein 5A3 [Hordeum vulgare subsp. vulgare]
MIARASHPAVHPAPMVAQAQGQGLAPAAAVAEQAGNGNAPPPGVLMEDLLWAPGTRCGLGNRLAQALLASAAVAFMASTNDFQVVTAYRYLVAAATLQFLWSFLLAIIGAYALLVKRSLRTPRLTIIFFIGDWVIGALIFTAASGSAAITFLIDDMRMCSENHCPSFRAATVLAFLSWFPIALSCLFNLLAAIHRVQSF